MYQSKRKYSITQSQLIALITLLFAFTFAHLPVSAQTNAVSIDNFGEVNEHYFRGSQPDEEEFIQLKNKGIKTIIDLRKDREKEAEGWALGQGLRYVNIPLTTKKAATAEQTAFFLELVNDPENWPVYVHCKGGRHRTGEMTAIYRITEDGWNADRAYEEMKDYDFKNNIFYPRALKKYVFSFYEQHVARQEAKAGQESSGSAQVQLESQPK